jgi:pimeloyl-ACP methyl ester carboxylesterase
MGEGLSKKRFPREHLTIDGAQVKSIDIKPEHQKDDAPVLVVPGWGATMESFEPGFKVLTERERRVLSLDQPRKGGTTPDSYPDSYNEDIAEWYKKKGQDYPDFPIEFLRQANTINGLLDQKKLDKVDVIAHSMGGPAVCLAAMLHPEKFIDRTIVLENSAGLIGEDSLPRLAKGAGANTSRTETMSRIPVTEAETEYLVSTKHITPDYIKANPLRAIKEIWAMSQIRIEDMLRYLHEKGVRIIVVGAVDDTFFPMGTPETGGMQKNVRADFIDGFVSVRGGHMQIQTHPELYMAAAESMLEQPKEKKD